MRKKSTKGMPVSWDVRPAEEKQVRALIEREKVTLSDGAEIRRFAHLDDATFVVVGKPKGSRVARVRAARPVERLFREHEARITHIIELSLDLWQRAAAAEREIALFTVLCHCGPMNDRTSRWTMRTPPLQEFPEVIQRFGAYTPMLSVLAQAVAGHDG